MYEEINHHILQKREHNLILKNHLEISWSSTIKELIYSYFIPVQQCKSLDIFINPLIALSLICLLSPDHNVL